MKLELPQAELNELKRLLPNIKKDEWQDRILFSVEITNDEKTIIEDKIKGEHSEFELDYDNIMECSDDEFDAYMQEYESYALNKHIESEALVNLITKILD